MANTVFSFICWHIWLHWNTSTTLWQFFLQFNHGNLVGLFSSANFLWALDNIICLPSITNINRIFSSPCRGWIWKTISHSNARSQSYPSGERRWLPHYSKRWAVGCHLKCGSMQSCSPTDPSVAQEKEWCMFWRRRCANNKPSSCASSCGLSCEAGSDERERGQHHCHCDRPETAEEDQGQVHMLRLISWP